LICIVIGQKMDFFFWRKVDLGMSR
jgi:hypothetical protein